MANFRGFSIKAGHRTKHSKKQMAAPRLHPAKTSMRSQRLTKIWLVYWGEECFGVSNACESGKTQELGLPSPELPTGGSTEKRSRDDTMRYMWGKISGLVCCELTGKETFLLLSSGGSRQRRARSFMGGKSQIALAATERVQGLQSGENGCGGCVGSDWNIGVSSRPAQRIHILTERG